MSTPEGKVKAKVKALIKQLNFEWQLIQDCHIYTHWPVQTGFGAPTLDCIGCHRGHFFAIETKAPGGVLTARQQATIREMGEAGAKVFVIGEEPTQDSLFPYSGLKVFEEWLRTL